MTQPLPSDADLAAWLSVAEEAARRGGELLEAALGSPLTVLDSPEHDLKLEADRESERCIVEILRQHSDWAILTEESGLLESPPGSDESQWRWIVDPLDGTANFSRNIPLWCVSIALACDRDPVLGVIFVPSQQELFTGIVGGGARRSGTAITVSDVGEAREAVLCTGVPVSTDFSMPALVSFAEQLRRYKKVRLLGTAALSLAYVAIGRADAYYERDIKIWDVAAGAAIVRAAGGTVSIEPSSRPNVVTVFASNGYIDAPT